MKSEIRNLKLVSSCLNSVKFFENLMIILSIFSAISRVVFKPTQVGFGFTYFKQANSTSNGKDLSFDFVQSNHQNLTQI